MPRRARIVLTMFFVFPRSDSPARARRRGRLDGYVPRAMAAWEVPGLGLAIVHRDSIVYARGFGVRELDSRERVDEHTMFAIGSSSKAFTALLLATLIDDGAAKWDDRVIEH